MSEDDRLPLDAVNTCESARPQWLTRLVNQIAPALQIADVMAPVGCHFHQCDGEWEVTLFVSGTEYVGGALDGQFALAQFMLDLGEVLEAFDSISSCYWQAQPMGDDDDLGPHVGVEGVVEGHSVWLRVTASPPRQFDAGRVVNVYADAVEQRW